jgi:hypothetical protein
MKGHKPELKMCGRVCQRARSQETVSFFLVSHQTLQISSGEPNGTALFRFRFLTVKLWGKRDFLLRRFFEDHSTLRTLEQYKFFISAWDSKRPKFFPKN